MSNLLSVIVNQNGYEYDIHSLVKAFYPAQDVKVFVPDSDEKDIVSSDEGLPDLKIDFEPEMIRMSIVDGVVERTEEMGNLLVTVANVYPKDKSVSFHVTSFIRIVNDKIISS